MFYANDLLKAPYTSLSIFITLSTEYQEYELKPKDAFHERIITHEVICFLRSDVKLFGKQICRSYVRDKLERCCLRTTLLLSSTYLESEMTSPKN